MIPTTRFYQVRGEHRTWARIWITSDGCISIFSDYGVFGYWFGAPGGEFRKFLTGCGDDYLRDKFSDGEREFDQSGTERAAKDLVLRARRDQDIDREEAREEWDAVLGVDWGCEYSRSKWYFEETKLVDWAASEILQRRIPMHVQMFVKELWPLFMAELEAELAAEAALTHPGFTD